MKRGNLTETHLTETPQKTHLTETHTSQKHTATKTPGAKLESSSPLLHSNKTELVSHKKCLQK